VRFTVNRSAYIRAPQRIVYSVLTSYRHLEAWVPDVVQSRLLASEGEIAIVELIAPPYGAEKLVLEMIESPRTAVVFTQVDRLRRDGLFGRFDLTRADDGAGTMLEATLGMKLGLHRVACRRRLRAVLDHTLAALTDRAIRLLTSGLSEVPGQRAKILEVDIAGSEVTLRVGGTTYELVRRSQETLP
jgi:hypothetical protein